MLKDFQAKGIALAKALWQEEVGQVQETERQMHGEEEWAGGM